MSSKNGETSTFEIETRETFDKILRAIGDLRQDFNQRFDQLETGQAEIRKEQAELRKDFQEFKNYVEVQFESVRRGLVKNYTQLDRLEAQIAENRMVIFNTKALVGELNERVFLLTRTTERTL